MEPEQGRGDAMEGIEASPSVESEHQQVTPQRENVTHPTEVDVEEQVRGDDMEGIEVPPSSGENEHQHVTLEREGTTHPTELRVDEPAGPDPSPRTPAGFALSLHDSKIKCVCPPGAIRLAKDIVFMGATKDGPRWTHLPCKPYAAAMAAETAEKVKNLIKRAPPAGTAFDPEAAITKLLGHAPNEKQRLFLKHFTSTFHCDGPCEGLKAHADFFLCKKCCAWQHKPCKLYGDPQDRGGPVCNRCYMSFMLHREEIVEWQRKRLLLAVKEGWDYLKNPENRHQEWRRAWIRRWLARFFHHVRHLCLLFMCLFANVITEPRRLPQVCHGEEAGQSNRGSSSILC